MNYQKLVIVGNVTRNPQHKKAILNTLTFRVAVSNSKDRPVFFPITMFGK